MRAPTWETSAGALAAFLNSTTQCYMADLYTITLVGGTVIRYTDRELATTINGNTFIKGPAILRGKAKLSVGISVDTMDLKINADSSVMVNGVPILQFIAGGGFDGANMLLERAFTSAPGADWIGTIGMFSGRVGPGQASRYEAVLTVNSDSELLNVMVPRNVYQPGCNNTLFDGACGLTKSSYAATVTASGATDATLTTFNVTPGITFAYYSQGFALCTAGANAGLSRTLKSNGVGYLQSIRPWAAPVSIGDTFTIYPGCDKQQATCSGKFSNLVHFRGQPYVPAPETIT